MVLPRRALYIDRSHTASGSYRFYRRCLGSATIRSELRGRIPKTAQRYRKDESFIVTMCGRYYRCSDKDTNLERFRVLIDELEWVK